VTNPLTRAARSLTGRLVITFLGVSVAIVLMVAIVAYRQARGALEEEVLERLRTIASSREQQLNRWIDGQTVEVKFLAGLPRLKDELQQAVLSEERKKGEEKDKKRADDLKADEEAKAKKKVEATTAKK